MEIKKTTTLGEIMKNYENAEEILKNFGMHCFYCPMSQMETLEEASAVHGIDLDFMLGKLKTDLIAKKSKGKK
ncbi:MAG: DUF1858 domain-containing protein [Clostridia bacterium]|nr:DUF1858 domain-containing protein [Clostridia bacterium]